MSMQRSETAGGRSTFDSLSSRGVQPTTVTYAAVISVLERMSLWQPALAVLEESRHFADVVTYGSAIDACLGAWRASAGLLDTMACRRVIPDFGCCRGVLLSVENAGHWRKVVELGHALCHQGLYSKETANSHAIAAAQRRSEWHCVLQIFQLGSPEFQEKTRNLGLAACEEGSCWQLALAILLDASAADVFAYTSVIGACAKAAQWQAALATFQATVAAAVRPNTVTCNSLVDAMASSSGQWQRALSFLSELAQLEVQSDEITWTSAIRACESCSEWQWSIALLDGMSVWNIMPNIVSYASVVRACRWSGAWSCALALMERMATQTIQADLLFCNMLLSLLAKAEQWRLACEFLATMAWNQMEPDETSWATVADVGKESSQWRVALGALSGCRAAATPLNAQLHTAAVSAAADASEWRTAMRVWSSSSLARENERSVGAAACAFQEGARWLPALELLRDDGLQPSAWSLNAAITASSRSSQWAASIQLLEDFRRARIEDDIFAHTAAVDACGRSSEVARALKLFASMEGRRLLADESAFNVAVAACEKAEKLKHAVVKSCDLLANINSWRQVQVENALGKDYRVSHAGTGCIVSFEFLGSRTVMLLIMDYEAKIAELLVPTFRTDPEADGHYRSLQVVTLGSTVLDNWVPEDVNVLALSVLEGPGFM
ncbi:Pentatricopeptide repeat-containing protein, chloroplastic [Symbiodinium microadriaticum]|uniref:Pentatricopeptide repeat-containing protein, chloroplastic n=1 Tax=Symbiodinium microadriaticum TaxID=2951 RepID=A0A1Q9E3S1_SYMMI|nr:Pentatricopeptide repeat-containing protein, chloroplastic [Symbiodinium microadriaticum]